MEADTFFTPPFYTLLNMDASQVAQTEMRMRPGILSEAGFLSATDRLIQVWMSDRQFLEKVNVTPRQIAESLRGLILEAKKSSQHFQAVQLGTKFEMTGTGIQTNGYQECPFLSGWKKCPVGRGDYEVKHLLTGESFSFSELGIHLIEDHQFFEGNTPYRMDPEKIVRVLDLTNSRHYKKINVSEWKWVEGMLLEEGRDLEKTLQKYAKEIIKIDDFAIAYLGIPFSDLDTFIYNGKTVLEKLVLKKREKNPETALSDEEIKEMIKNQNARSFFKQDLDKKIEQEPGKEYLYLINSQNRRGNSLNFEVKKIPIKENLSIEGVYIFELKETSYNTAMIH